jgi:hypothetical protein
MVILSPSRTDDETPPMSENPVGDLARKRAAWAKSSLDLTIGDFAGIASNNVTDH